MFTGSTSNPKIHPGAKATKITAGLSDYHWPHCFALTAGKDDIVFQGLVTRAQFHELMGERGHTTGTGETL